MKRQILASAALLFALCACSTPAESIVLDIEGGKVQGVETEISGVLAYKGIPYAAPPVGDLRWKDPQPVKPWDGVKIADTFGAPSVQSHHTDRNAYTSEFFFDGDPEFSEDCLYLNVYTKFSGQKDRKAPVALWIHGGGYVAGWGWEPEMAGAEWANKDVVLVTFNYRLGVFGFMTHPLLNEESPNGISGNYGIKDQIACLKWVYNNIEQFGGDPENITIFGQSAGGGSVRSLVASPLTGNMIKKAVIQSAGAVSRPNPDRPAAARPAKSIEEISSVAKEVFDWAGYDTLEKMRAASTEEVFGLASKYQKETGKRASLSSGNFIDNYVNVKSFDQAAIDGTIKNIPYMIGFTLDDMGGLGSAAGIDYFCELREEAGIPAYSYQFVRSLPDNDPPTHALSGAFHSSELWYTFKSLSHSDRPFTEGDYDLAEKMLTCWTNFVKTGNPGEGWTANTKESHKYMIFDVKDNKASLEMGNTKVREKRQK